MNSWGVCEESASRNRVVARLMSVSREQCACECKSEWGCVGKHVVVFLLMEEYTVGLSVEVRKMGPHQSHL